MKNRGMRSGFTMTQALCGIALMCIMFVLGYVGLNRVWNNNQIDMAENDLRDFANSFSNYHMDYSKIVIEADANYQAALENIVDTLNRQYLSATVEIDSISGDRKSCVLRTKTKKDPWGNRYKLHINTEDSADGGMLVIYSLGIDGVDDSHGYVSGDYSDDVIVVVQPKV